MLRASSNLFYAMAMMAFLSFSNRVLEKRDYSFLREIALSDEMQKRKQDWKNLISQKDRSLKERSIEEEYQQQDLQLLTSVHALHPITSEPLSLGVLLDMPGVAMIAAYLTEKKDLSGLFVCSSLEALVNQAKRILDAAEDRRSSLIVGTTPYHKSALFLEKKGKEIRMVWMEAGNVDPTCPVFMFDLADLYISKGFVVELFNSTVQRQFSVYGCAVFALQDSISFLQDPNFFSRIHPQSKVDGVYILSDLPPEYMIGTQSLKSIKNYKAFHSQENLTFSLPKRRKNLIGYLQKYVLINESNIEQNHYITRKHFHYLDLVVTASKTLSPAEIQGLIQTTLVTK